MNQLERRTIPELKIKKIKKGPRCIIKRSYPFGVQDFFRRYKGDLLRLEVKFEEGVRDIQVALHCDLHGEWSDIEFSQINSTTFSVELRLSRCGLFQFKTKYSFNHGETWFLDDVPYSYCYVDPSSMREIRIYTLIPNISGHIGQWSELLNHIQDMGFNFVHLLPITELDGSESPYAAYDLFNIDPWYAIPGDSRSLHDQFESFVRKAKELHIGLCFDLVLNHVGVTGRIARNCPDWIATDTAEPNLLKRAGCWEGLQWRKWEDLVLIKYDHPNQTVKHEIWNYFKEYALFWANYANYTGGMIRLDNLHSTNMPFFNYLMKTLKNNYPELVVYAELFTDPSTMERMFFEHGLNIILATPWFSPYAEQMRSFIKYLQSISHKIRYLFPLNSHDSGAPAQEYGRIEATIPRYTICALLGCGQTGFSQGVEFGIPEKIPFIGKQNRWEMNERCWGFDFKQQISEIHRLHGRSIFQLTGNLVFIDQNHPAVIAAYRYNPHQKSDGYLILACFDTSKSHRTVITLEKEAMVLIGHKLQLILHYAGVQPNLPDSTVHICTNYHCPNTHSYDGLDPVGDHLLGADGRVLAIERAQIEMILNPCETRIYKTL